jgi:hypothetical protein
MIDTFPLTDVGLKVIIEAQEGRLPRLTEAEVDRTVNTILGMSKLMDDWKKENNVDDNFRKKSLPR